MLHIKTAQGFWRRFRGLMLTKRLHDDEGLFFADCPSVHTCFVLYLLDIVYLDQQGNVVKLVSRLKPWRFSWGGRQAMHVLELAAGTIERLSIRQGDYMGCFMAHVPDILCRENPNDKNNEYCDR